MSIIIFCALVYVVVLAGALIALYVAGRERRALFKRIEKFFDENRLVK